jgi:transcriptional regulator with XRE-family HTH domain
MRTEREQHGMSQQQLAQQAGVAIGTVRALETRRTVEPGFFTVLALAQALRIDVTELVDRTTKRSPTSRS